MNKQVEKLRQSVIELAMYHAPEGADSTLVAEVVDELISAVRTDAARLPMDDNVVGDGAIFAVLIKGMRELEARVAALEA